MHKNLEEREKEIQKEQDEMDEMDVEDLEMKRLRTAQENAQQKKQESVTLQDLFNKYGIWDILMRNTESITLKLM